MTQESLRRYWNKTKNKSGVIIAGLLAGCTIFCTPYTSINAGASGIDPLPPFTQANSGYIKNGCFNGTFFLSNEELDATGEFNDRQFFSLGTQDNYTKEIGANNVYYVPNKGAYDYKNGQWLTEIFGESEDRPESHVLQGQIQVDTNGSEIYFGMELQETWVEINTFKALWDNCQITVTQDMYGTYQSVAECEYIGFRVEYIGQAGELLSWYFDTEKRANGTYDLRKRNDITPTYSFTDTAFPFETRGYIYVKDLQFLAKARIEHAGLARVRISKTDSIQPIALSVAKYTQDVNKMHMNFYEEHKDIGKAFFSPVVAFINTEIFPGFTFGTLMLISLGLIVLGLYLKFALGG